jgi:hypothetical protein
MDTTIRRADLITEVLTDAFWSERQGISRSVTDPTRMVLVIEEVINILRSQPRHEDDNGSLAWAAWWLESQLEIDAAARKEGLL